MVSSSWWMKEMITVFTETRHGEERRDAYGVNTANVRASKRTCFLV